MTYKGRITYFILFFLLSIMLWNGNVYSQETLIFADMAAPNSVTAKCAKWWGNEIEKRTEGKVKFEYYFGASLIGAYEQLTSVKNNMIQVTPYYSGYHPDMAPIPLIALFPMINRSTLANGLKAADEFFNNNSQVIDEFKKNNVKYMNPLFTAHGYMWSKKPINSISDFKDLSVRAFGPFLTFVDALGGSLVSLPVPEIYNSLERGVVESTFLYLTLGVSLNLQEVTKYLNTSNLGHNCGMPMVMNLDTWKKLPEDVKKVIEDVNKNIAIDNFVRIDKENYKKELQFVKNEGIQILEFSQSDLVKMQKIAREKVWNSYAKKLEEKGLSGMEIINEYIEITNKYQK